MKKKLIILLATVACAGPAFAGSVPTTYASRTGFDDLGTGSGVIIGPHEVLTAHHVIDGCTAINVFGRDAYVDAYDQTNDLAIVHTKDTWASWAQFSNEPVRAGDAVVAMGYPLSGVLADTANVSPGFVSALAGMQNDSRVLQITAPVQPGNSGGARYDSNGGIVGIVESKLGLHYTEMTGDIPQNVNFAINDCMHDAGFNVKQQGCHADEAIPTVTAECYEATPLFYLFGGFWREHGSKEGIAPAESN
jgi:S1-C subfamily serine protease